MRCWMPRVVRACDSFSAISGSLGLDVIRRRQGRNAEVKQLLDQATAISPDRRDEFVRILGTDGVTAARERFAQAGLASFDEDDTTCCYALQDKVWVHDPAGEVGEIFLRCSAKEIVERCAKTVTELVGKINGSTAHIPEVRIYGHLDATFPYIYNFSLDTTDGHYMTRS